VNGFLSLEKADDTRIGWMSQIRIDFLVDSVRSDPWKKEFLNKVNLH